MKPIKVIMQAFGPYEARTECDFTKLNDSKLFLITGQTGAGKTTILDAISFAIYGKATGELRSFKEMRNTTAPNDLHTYVEAQIKIGNGIYKFVRDVNAAPSKVRKTGELKENWKQENSVYERKDNEWKLLHTGKDVDEFGKSVTGFTHQQFSQVIVLPQGEFKKLLTANSTEKEKILEVLFATTKWKNLTDRLCFLEKSLKGKLASFDEQVKGVLGANNAENVDELERRAEEFNAQQETATEEYKRANDAFVKANEAYNEAVATNKLFAEQIQLTDDLLKLKEQESKINEEKSKIAVIETGDKIYPYYQNVNLNTTNLKQLTEKHIQSESRLKASENEFLTAKKELENKNALQEQKESLAVELNKLTEISKIFDEYKKAQDEVEVISKKLENKKQEKEKAEQDGVTLKQRIANGEKEIAKIDEEFATPLPKYKDEFNKLSNALGLINSCKQTRENFEKLKKSADEKKSQLDSLNNSKSATEKAVALMEQKIAEDAAFKLAITLKEGEACPVCGSTSHPFPCKKAIETPSKEEVDALKAELEHSNLAITKAEREYNLLVGEGNSLLTNINETNEKIKEFGVDEQEVETKLAELKAKIAVAEEQIDKKPTYVKAVNKFKEQQQLSEETAKTIGTELEKMGLSHASLTANLENIEKKLEGKTKDQTAEELTRVGAEVTVITNKITKLENEFNTASNNYERLKAEVNTQKENIIKVTDALEKSKEDYKKLCDELKCGDNFDFANYLAEKNFLTQYKKDVENYSLAITGKNDRLKTVSEQLNGKEKADLETVKTALDDSKAKWSTAGAKLGEIKSHIENIGNAVARIKKIKKDFEKEEKEYKTVSTLAKLLKGDNELKTPIHQFVLGIMLEDIIKTANVYFAKLSKGQYSLVRRDVAGGRGYNGLELFVMDAQRSGIRTVNTLSGGELFIASLSLAFGLSDVVQAFAGGVYLDSIFIDEGFGTLDEETLDCAMKALTEIQKSGRMVGIISHVKELRERIAARIEITKDSKGGSKLEVISI